MEINVLAVGIAVVLQFIVGAVWYGPLLFGNLWAKMHDCDKLSKEELQKLQAQMMHYYGVQLFVTIVTTVVLAILMRELPEFSPFSLAGILWIGFVVPTQVSAVIFGKDEKKWVAKKLSIMAGASLVCLLIATTVISYFQ